MSYIEHIPIEAGMYLVKIKFFVSTGLKFYYAKYDFIFFILKIKVFAFLCKILQKLINLLSNTCKCDIIKKIQRFRKLGVNTM